MGELHQTRAPGMHGHTPPMAAILQAKNMRTESAQLKDAGLKTTLPRLKVLSVLEDGSGKHMSAEDVYHALHASGENVGLATIYRVLTQFESAGLVVRHQFESGSAVFELDSGEHHDHIVCVDCGKVVEFLDQVIEKRQRNIANAHQFEIVDHTLTIYGRCPACVSNARRGL